MPAHAFSETDRLTARAREFRALPQALGAERCWRNWWRAELTPHDGLVRAEHPVLRAILARTQSASSLRLLLRNPLGFVWRYGLGWRAPESRDDPLVLDALDHGELVHQILDRALRLLEAHNGLSKATEEQIVAAVEAGAGEAALRWESERAVPPPVIWRRTLTMARELSRRGLAARDAPLGEARAYGEVAFGGAGPKSDAAAPWDEEAAVEIPDTGFRIAGYIDRLDLSVDGHAGRSCATTRPAALPPIPSPSTAARSCSAASMPSPRARCWAMTSPSTPRSSICARRGPIYASKRPPPRCLRPRAICAPLETA